MKIYVCVDCQNDFIDGVLGTVQAQIAVPKICKEILKNFPNAEDTGVIFTKDTHYDNYLTTQEGKNLPIEHCIYDTDGWRINDEIWEATDFLHDTAKVFSKETFGSENLVKCILLNEDIIDEIIFMGFCTDICIITNALMVKAAAPEIPIKVKADCCAGVTPEKHAAALEVMRSCQIEII